ARQAQRPGPPDDAVDVALDGALVEGVDDGGLRGTAPRADRVGDVLELGLGPAGEEDPRPLAGEGAGDGPADRSARAVDHRDLALQQHRSSVLSARVATRRGAP